MRPFEHKNATTFEEASTLLTQVENGKAAVLAGGTDLLNGFKQAILAEYPDSVINLKSIPGSAGISNDGAGVTIEALTTLTDIAESDAVREKAVALAEAAHSVASPLIRNIGTIGGNICQDVRCWYYRYPHSAGGRMNCARKGGATCYAVRGENRYHSILGGMKAHVSECTKGCPAGTDIPAYMAKIREGDWDTAARIVMRVNPMPMITSRICPHPCQDDCNQTQYGDCVSIMCVERSLGDYILDRAEVFYAKPVKETGKNIGIIGAGPGGLACAYYMRSQGHGVTVIDVHEKAGGVLRYGIPHYRLPRQIVDRFVEALAGMGVTFEMNKTVGKDIQAEDIQKRFDSIYLGTGAWKQPILGISGEELTQFGLDFLVEVNTYLKKAAQFGSHVLVCGGGNVAMDVALTAVRLGAKDVTLACLEQEHEMPAQREEIARAKEEGVKILNGLGLSRVITDKAGKVTGLETKACVSVFDENGRFAPKYDEQSTSVIDSDCIILATGQGVDISFLGDKLATQIKSDRGLIGVVDKESFKTNLPNVYAGGDVVTGPNIAIRAINAGVSAAKSMSRALGTPFVNTSEESGFLHFNAEGVEKSVGAKLPERPINQRTLTDEDAASLSREQAEAEAGRCMNCGCYSVNASDISPALVALGGTIITTKKRIPAADFFTTKLKATDMLDNGELVTAVHVPDMSGYRTGYIKERIRPAIDFAILSLAYAYMLEGGKISSVSLVFGGAAPVPVKLTEVESYLVGKTPSAETAKAAGELAAKGADPMSKNTYKVRLAEAMVKRFVEGMQ
ncbi:MAG: FAD binding domain-containing protein [Synergistaceae bacterium]|jgi:NADPH-dependent glutamate synthase beta subunit-like oxidoreductase|nr:FAD binding domain-containing protein [Synergistaceae bacterium]